MKKKKRRQKKKKKRNAMIKQFRSTTFRLEMLMMNNSSSNNKKRRRRKKKQTISKRNGIGWKSAIRIRFETREVADIDYAVLSFNILRRFIMGVLCMAISIVCLRNKMSVNQIIGGRIECTRSSKNPLVGLFNPLYEAIDPLDDLNRNISYLTR